MPLSHKKNSAGRPDYFVAGAAGAGVGAAAGAGVVSAAGFFSSSLGAMALSIHPATEKESVAISSRAAMKARVFLILRPSFPSMNVRRFRNHLNNPRGSVSFVSSKGMRTHE
jgi:hypothetical protein